jgi:hypothetical protein
MRKEGKMDQYIRILAIGLIGSIVFISVNELNQMKYIAAILMMIYMTLIIPPNNKKGGNNE